MKSLNKIGRDFVKLSGVNCTLAQHIARANEEMHELYAEAVAYPPDWAATAEEMADVIITLAVGAAQLGLDLDAALAAKVEKCMARKWGPHPTIPGAVKHIKEGK